MVIGSNRTTPPPLLPSDIFKHMCLTNLSDDSNQPLNTLQFMDYRVLMAHENTELIPSGDCYDLSRGNYDTNKHATPVLFGKPVINQLGWVDIVKEDLA